MPITSHMQALKGFKNLSKVCSLSTKTIYVESAMIFSDEYYRESSLPFYLKRFEGI